MRDRPSAIAPAVPHAESRYANPPRTWQVITTGGDLSACSAELVADLGRFLDLRPDVTHLEIETENGGIFVARDWPSDYLEEADAILTRIRAAPGIRTITLPQGR
jgi:hypothetical protein